MLSRARLVVGSSRHFVGSTRLVAGSSRHFVGSTRLIVGSSRHFVGSTRLVAGSSFCFSYVILIFFFTFHFFYLVFNFFVFVIFFFLFFISTGLNLEVLTVIGLMFLTVLLRCSFDCSDVLDCSSLMFF